MRIAVVTWTRRRAGGTESYLAALVPALVDAGHAVAFWHEVDIPDNRPRMELPDEVQTCCVAERGVPQALAELRDWRPDVLYCHGLSDPVLEEQLLDVAPAVLFIHNYYGTCISGLKAFKNPVVRPCSRTFGPACLLHYYPHRCGGWNPLTMLGLYRQQGRRLALLPRYRLLLTHSEHMRQEYVKHGLPPERVRVIPFYVPGAGPTEPPVPQPTEGPLRLLFLGRMELLKGGHVLLEALPTVAAWLQRPVHLTMAGDGPERPRWEAQAQALQAGRPDIAVAFPGWLDEAQKANAFRAADVLVLPSLWPEPFGMVGVEAGRFGVPAVAFDVGGVRAWLQDGVNGVLAPGDPPTAAGLAKAIDWCLKERLSVATPDFGVALHLASLIGVLTSMDRA